MRAFCGHFSRAALTHFASGSLRTRHQWLWQAEYFYNPCPAQVQCGRWRGAAARHTVHQRQ